MASSERYSEMRRSKLKKIAKETLDAQETGYYSFKGVDYRLEDPSRGTAFLPPESATKLWTSVEHPSTEDFPPAYISVLQISTMDAARILHNAYQHRPNVAASEKTGVLNYASATKPGGGFLNGAEAQEESIARSSTLYPSLCSQEATKFYALHKDAQNMTPSYSHAIIYSPNVTVFRDDDGGWTYPFNINVVTCAAVNAGELRKATGPITAGLDVEIETTMRERMGRILYVFEQDGVRNLVLGTFGTGVFRNKVATVARIWASLLVGNGRFKYSFKRIIFAITGMDAFAEFQSAFDAWAKT
ncbi:hypothetical protein CPC08DRAFT_424712 [Agrocybe pediades]|nr:hypothetical protein CPC08DRAFT_424712 [Agrocybe pediades]